MKKIIALLVVLYFAAFCLVGKSLAIETTLTNVTSVEYPLPYPGILPDNPLYFLKVARDSLVLLAVTDPVRKSFYSLLLADKRLAAGEMLVSSNRVAVGVATLAKAEEYYQQASQIAENQRSKIKDQKLDEKYNDLLSKLTVAGAKHEEILVKMAGKVSEKENRELGKARQNNLEARKRIMELLLQNRQ